MISYRVIIYRYDVANFILGSAVPEIVRIKTFHSRWLAMLYSFVGQHMTLNLLTYTLAKIEKIHA
jgi:hypothetical protein